MRALVIFMIVACVSQAAFASPLFDDDFGFDQYGAGLGAWGGNHGCYAQGYGYYNPSCYNPYRIYRGSAAIGFGPAGVYGGYRGPFGGFGAGYSGIFGSGSISYRPRYPSYPGYLYPPISAYSGFANSDRRTSARVGNHQ